MKKNKLINGLLVIFCLSALAVSCSDDGDDKASVGFAGIASSYVEGDGDQTIVIPFVNGSVSASDIIIDGSATEGDDYEIVGVTAEGVEITLLDDSDCEDIETVRLRIKGGSSNGNGMHIVTLVSNSDEVFTAAEIVGDYVVDTDEWEDYHEGDEITVEAVDETHLRIVGYPATGFSHVSLVVTINDFATGAATVESQNNGSYNESGTQTTTTTGSGTISKCSNSIDLNLNFNLTCCGAFNNNQLLLVRATD